MSTLNLKSLVSKLNLSCHSALEQAASLCLNRSHYNVELEHWLLMLIGNEQSALFKILQTTDTNVDKLSVDLNFELEKLKTGNDQTPAISPRIIDLINESWLVASLEYNGAEIHSGILLYALLQNNLLNQIAHGISDEFKKIDLDAIKKQLNNYNEDTEKKSDDTSDTTKGKNTKTPSLDQFTINLNEQAKSGKIDAAIGREDEIRQVIDILGRRRQNNAILTGEPGVGKTAIIEGLALRIVSGDIPDSLNNVVIHSLDMGLLQAGAGVKGEFENRLKNLVKEVKASPHPIILFIDEAHTIIGAGAQAGQNDAANLLKPALARGELRSIAATTWAEYKQYFEKDAALTRRFQVVKVEEPDADTAARMLRSLTHSLEKHHNVRIIDNAVQSATLLSQRYITGRQLPDKSISVLDTACARVASKQTTTPASIEKSQKLLAQLEIELEQLKKETKQGISHKERLITLKQTIKSEQANIHTLTKSWQQQKKCVSQIVEKSHQLEALTDQKGTTKLKPIQKELIELTKKLEDLQAKNPLIQAYVDDNAVAEVIADWTGIPVGKMMKDEASQALHLADHLRQRIVGQDHSLEHIASTIRTSSAKLTDPNKPIGVFLFVGPSGVGKTETALALAESLYGSEDKMTVINMSEFKEEHKVSLLAGSPPGYVGYGEGGVLTEAVRRKPYSLVLLDEIEKAHAGIQDVFYQVFDKGMLKDGQGRDINFKNTLIIMTSNACSELISSMCADPETAPDPEALIDTLTTELTKFFKPAFLGRLNIIPYLPLQNNVLADIIKLKLKRIQDRVSQEHNIKLSVDKAVLKHILDQCQHQEIGARQVDNIISKSLLPRISEVFLSNIIDDAQLAEIQVKIAKDDTFELVTKAKR